MFTKAFWLAVLERAVKTFAQATVAAAGFTTVDAHTLAVLHDTWATDLELGAAAAVLSVLMSVASFGVRSDGPSLATETTTAAAAPVDGHAGLDYVVPAAPADGESADLL